MDKSDYLLTTVVIIGALAVYTGLILVIIRRFFWPDYIKFAEKLIGKTDVAIEPEENIRPKTSETKTRNKETVDPSKSYLRS